MKSISKDLAAGQAIYMGVDLHRGSWHITIRTQERVLHTETLRAGGKKAIVAVAHNLLLRIRRILLDGVPYSPEVMG